MTNMNEIIVRNIQNTMRNISMKQINLATAIGVSKQTMSKIMSGERMINAIELAQIAKALNVSTDVLVRIPQIPVETNAVRVFMGEVNTPAAKRGLEIADHLADMICFHLKCKENGESMLKPWSD